MFNIILILFAFVIAQIAAQPSIRELAQLHPEKPGGVALILLFNAVVVVAFILIGHLFRRVLAQRLKAAPSRTEEVYGLARTFSTALKGMLLAFYFIILTPLNWFSVSELIAPPAHVLYLHFLLKLLPFLILLMLSWFLYYRMEMLFGFRTWNLSQYFGFQVRQTLVILVPLLIFNFAFEAVEQSEAIQEYMTLYPELVLASFVPMMALIYTLIPILARFMWTVESFPKGYLRGRLETLCRDNGVKIRDILLWHTGRASIINAAVLGLFGVLRYVIITDGLIKHLSDSEVEAVFGHELGHAKHRHIAIYASFLIVISYITMFIMGFVSTGNGIVDSITQLVITFGIFIGLVFGFISRRFERQADMFGCKVVGNTTIFVNALEKVALYSGNVRNLRSWMHASIDSRVRFLTDAMYYPEIGRRFQKRVRLMAMGVVSAFALCIGWAGANFFLAPYRSRLVEMADAYKQILPMVNNTEERLSIEWKMAGLYEKAGRYNLASRTYDKALENEEGVLKMLRDRHDNKTVAQEARSAASKFIAEKYLETATRMLSIGAQFDPDNPHDREIARDLTNAYFDNIRWRMSAGGRERSVTDVSETPAGNADRLLQMEAERALPALELSMSISPGDKAQRALMARAYLIAGKYQQAFDIYRSLAETAPTPENIIWCGLSAGFAGDVGIAQEMLFVRSRETADRTLLEEARRRVALWYSYNGSPETMRNLFAVWGCLDPGSARFAHFFSAEALYLARVDESALSAYLAAIGAFPENAYYRFRLGEVYMALGRQAEAVEQFNRAAAMRAWKNPLRKDYLAETAAALQVTDQGEEASDFEATGMHSMGDGR